MAGALLHCPPASETAGIVVLGLGGGALPAFLQTKLPQSHVTAVDIDAKLVEIATNLFKMPKEVKTEVDDGLAYIEKMGERGETADYVFVDIDCKDLKGVASFPPRPFLEVKTSGCA